MLWNCAPGAKRNIVGRALLLLLLPLSASISVVSAQVCTRRLVASPTTVSGMASYYGSSSGADASGNPGDGPGSASPFSEHFAQAPSDRLLAQAPSDRLPAALDHTLQMCLYHQISTKLCIQGAIPMEAYIQRNGPLSYEHPFGEFHWRGLIEEYMAYRWQHLLAEISILKIGWVLIPGSFSRDNAAMPPCPGDSMYYPAVIEQDPQYGELARMACKHIAIMNSRPWWLHVSRLCQLQSFTAVMRYYEEAEYRRRTHNYLNSLD